MNILKSTIRIASVALAMLTAGILQAADAAQEWQKGPSDVWFVKWDEAAAESKKTGKPIFVLKTGSDWCGWCIRLRKNVLSKPEFEAFAEKNLVLLYLDSPSKTPLCAEQKKHNQEVSRKLSLGGGVPNASVVTADGKKLGSISGGEHGLDAYLEKLKELLGKGLAKEDEKTAAPEAAQGHSMKLPYALMPKSGRIADYDFEGFATNRVPSTGKIVSRDLQIVAGALYSPGDYGNCCRIDIPEINYDNLTVALSFMPEGANKGSWIPVFSFGEPWGSSIRWFNASIRRDHTLEFGFNAYGYTIKTGVEVKMGEWNYLVCSVDAVNKKVVASVNGNVCEWELPVDFAWQFSDMRSREECRCIGFSNRNFGLVYKGSIDDFLVYDCALGKDEVSAIAAGKSPARHEASSSGRTVHKTAVRRDVAAIPGGKWLFVPSTERSLYWNGEMRDGNWTLDVHREGANLVVQPQYTRGSGVLDLKKPVVDETGAKLAVTGVGYSRGGCHCLYHPSVTEVVLPDTLTKIYPEAFSWCKFSSVAIPEGVSEIGEQAFSHCSNLSGVVIPSSVKEIGDRAFQECKSLVSVDIQGTGVKVAKLAFRGDTPVGAKMPDLSQPIGPIHVRFEPVTAAAASAQGLLSRLRAKRWSRLQQEVSQSVDSEKARKARAAQRSQFSAGSLSTEFERERDTLFMDIVREAEICQTNLAEYATYPYWPDAMGVISNFCAQEGCVMVDAGHHFGAWRQGCGKKACVATSDLKRRRLFIPNVRTEYVDGVRLISRGDDGFCLISRGGAYTNAACSGVGTICCYDSDGRFEGLYDSVDKLPGMQDCLSAGLKRNYAEQDRWMVVHGFSEEGSGREAEAKLDAARTNAIGRLEALDSILFKLPQWKSDNRWRYVCDVREELKGPSASGFYHVRRHFSAPEINTNDAVFVKMNERFENLGRSQDRLIEGFVRDLTGLEFGSLVDTNGVLDLKFNLGSYENCIFGRVSGTGVLNSVTLIAEFDPSCEQKTIHEKLDQSLSTLLSAIGMDRDSLSYNVPSNEARPLLGRLRRPGEDWKSVQSFSQRFTISRNKQQSGEYVVTISDRRKVDVPASNDNARQTGELLGGGSLRARRLQRQQQAAADAAKQRAEQAAKNAERQAQAEQERTQREAERAEQRRQLQAINEELKKVREQKAAAAKSERITSCITNKPTSGKGVVAEKLGQCDFLLNKDFKKNAKFYLCLFSASWCPPCRREMPRIAKTYAETLKDDPEIELIHFSRDQNDEKAMAWAKEHDVKFPVVKPSGGNPLDLHSRGIPHLFIVKADGTVLEEGHPMRIFNAEKFRELKGGSPAAAAKVREGDGSVAASASGQCAGKMPSQFMPTKGLLASFDYDDGKETNAGYGEVRRENDHVSFVEGAADYDGVYKYSSRGGRFKQGDRFEEDYVVPELNFDRFTVACSFRPTHTNNWGQYFFRIGQTCYSILEVSLSRGEVSVYGRKLRNLSVPYMDREWNWLAVSVDVAKREAWLSVNGCEPVSTSLPEDFFWFVPSDSVSGDKFRRLTFGNWQCGERYCGQVDDLMVYDRALGREEFADVCRQTVKAKGPAVASFEKSAPAKLPELRDDRWLFIPHDEQSVYWNGAIKTKDVSLKVRREVDGLCVEPPGDIADSVLDLTLPVVDASGQPLSIVGVGSECDPYCICARKATMSEVRLPDTLRTIRKNAFAGCMKLESIVIPENVREIGSFAFTDCGHLTKLEIRSKSVAVARDAFSGSTPVGTDMPQRDWTTGPLTKEIKGDPKFEYAKDGRMADPLFSFGYDGIRFGAKYGDCGGLGSTRMKEHLDWGEFDVDFIKLGEDQLAGVTLKWRKKESAEGSVDGAKAMAKELVALIEEKVKGKIRAPLYQPESQWAEYGDKGNYYADYTKLKPIGSSKTEVNGYTVKVDVYGGTKDVNVAVVITIIDNYMFKAWGMKPKI